MHSSNIRHLLLACTVVAPLFSFETSAVELHFESTRASVLEDAVLFVGNGSACPSAAIALGDIDLQTPDYQFALSPATSYDSWWLLGYQDGGLVYSSNQDLTNASLFNTAPFNSTAAGEDWTPEKVHGDLERFTSKTVKLRFGVMSDTHYYSDPYGFGHPLERQDPVKYNLKANLEKMHVAFDQFKDENVDFVSVLGDLVEDQAGWELSATWPANGGFIPDGALYTNMANLKSLFDQYLYPIHLVIGNHDTGYGTTRSELYDNLSYYAQENYDASDYANRMDYTFDIKGVRFIVFDNVNPIPVPGIRAGFRWASPNTLQYLTRELAKVSTGGVDEGMPVILMSHARIDCLQAKACSQKVDITNKAKYKWTRSLSGTDQYYLQAVGGGDPNLEDAQSFNRFVWINNSIASVNTIGSLTANSWAYGRATADNLSFDTVYIRLSPMAGGSVDPNLSPAQYIQYKYISEGASENFEDQMAILDAAKSNGANILASFAGHHHISDYNVVHGINYFTITSPKTSPQGHAIVEVLYDGSIYVRGFGIQATYNSRKPYVEQYDCSNASGIEMPVEWSSLVSNHQSHASKSPSYNPTPLWSFNNQGQHLIDLNVDLQLSGKTYESASSGGIAKWEIYDNDPFGAVITNVFDDQAQSRVIQFTGDTYRNGYALRNNNLAEWSDSSGFILQWSMKFNETYIIRAKVLTTDGTRYLRYTAVNSDALGSGQSVEFGLGSDTQDGQWRTYVRDLKADLALAQPGITILEVDTFFVQGSGRVDNVKLHKTLPPADSDRDGLSDQDELSIYGTSPFDFDTDHDGMSDGTELKFWGDKWHFDSDQDGVVNLKDSDSDGDNVLDGREVAAGSNPIDPYSGPLPKIYEDSEDGTTRRWQIFDNDPPGALVSNSFDKQRQSRVITFKGENYANGFALRTEALKEWNDNSGFILQWSMRFSETYIVDVKIKTSSGATRYLRYTGINTNGPVYADIDGVGLGAVSKDGQWRTFTRDLKADLKRAQPNIEIQSVMALQVRGNGAVDDVKLHSGLTPADKDLDGVSDADELVYGTSSLQLDSDHDGISDRAELLYWGDNWNQDPDADGVANMLDPDSDNDTVTDGEEIITYSTHPGALDTDNDTLDDDDELLFWGSRWSEDIDSDGLANLVDNDSDGDGSDDGVEIEAGFDPADPESFPTVGC